MKTFNFLIFKLFLCIITLSGCVASKQSVYNIQEPAQEISQLGAMLQPKLNTSESSNDDLTTIDLVALSSKHLDLTKDSTAISSMKSAWFTAPESYYHDVENPKEKISLSSRYGKRGSRFHYGLDFRAPKGTEILSYQSGEVIFAARRSSFGLLVEIDHGDGTIARYAHMSKILIKKGDVITAGDTLGLVGNTGRSYGNHLHLEILIDNKRVDPYTYVQSSEMVLRYTPKDSQVAQQK